jgi:hypothetical protein
MLVPGDLGDVEFHIAVGAGLVHGKSFDLSLDDCLFLMVLGRTR